MRSHLIPGLILLAILLLPVAAMQVFTTEEVDRIKITLNQMTDLVSREHEEILQMEEVLSSATTALRSARLKEKIETLMKSVADRIRDLRKLRSTFMQVPQLREYCIALDDRLNEMEKNLRLIDEIYFPKALEIAKPQAEAPWPTFINPGDPRFELEEHEARLAKALQKGADVLTLAIPNRQDDDRFQEFLGQLDTSLKDEDKPKRPAVPVIATKTLDDFHKQLDEARRKDATFSWEENASDVNFRRFLQSSEKLHQKPSENQRIISNHPRIDEPDSAKSSKSFAELVLRIDDSVRAREKKRVVLASSGVMRPVEGFNSFMNDTRVDSHSPTVKDFSSFVDGMEPVSTEVQIRQNRVKPTSVLEDTLPLYEEEDFVEYLTTPASERRQMFGHPAAMAAVPAQVEAHSPATALVTHQLGGRKSLIPITLSLLDDERKPHVKIPVEFVLSLSSRNMVAGILESQGKDPMTHSVVTNESGEALVHLLVEAEAHSIRVQRVVSIKDPADSGVRCELIVTLL